MTVHVLCPHVAKRAERKPVLPSLLIRALTPFMRAPSPWPNYLPKVPPPSTIKLGSRISTYEFGGDTNMQSVSVFLLCKQEVLNHFPNSIWKQSQQIIRAITSSNESMYVPDLCPSIVTPRASGSFIVLCFLQQEDFCFLCWSLSPLPGHNFIYMAAKMSKDGMRSCH